MFHPLSIHLLMRSPRSAPPKGRSAETSRQNVLRTLFSLVAVYHSTAFLWRTFVPDSQPVGPGAAFDPEAFRFQELCRIVWAAHRRRASASMAVTARHHLRRESRPTDGRPRCEEQTRFASDSSSFVQVPRCLACPAGSSRAVLRASPHANVTEKSILNEYKVGIKRTLCFS
jgi:hypothetical protein